MTPFAIFTKKIREGSYCFFQNSLWKKKKVFWTKGTNFFGRAHNHQWFVFNIDTSPDHWFFWIVILFIFKSVGNVEFTCDEKTGLRKSMTIKFPANKSQPEIEDFIVNEIFALIWISMILSFFMMGLLPRFFKNF